MNKPRKHPWQFAHRVLPEAFFADPGGLVARLTDPGGQEVLDELWTQAGALLGEERVDARVRYDFEPMGSWNVVVVRLVEPEAPTGVWYAALCWSPPRPTLLVFATQAQARLFLMEKTEEGAALTEWTVEERIVHEALFSTSRREWLNRLVEILG